MSADKPTHDENRLAIPISREIALRNFMLFLLKARREETVIFNMTLSEGDSTFHIHCHVEALADKFRADHKMAGFRDDHVFCNARLLIRVNDEAVYSYTLLNSLKNQEDTGMINQPDLFLQSVYPKNLSFLDLYEILEAMKQMFYDSGSLPVEQELQGDIWNRPVVSDVAQPIPAEVAYAENFKTDTPFALGVAQMLDVDIKRDAEVREVFGSETANELLSVLRKYMDKLDAGFSILNTSKPQNFTWYIQRINPHPSLSGFCVTEIDTNGYGRTFWIYDSVEFVISRVERTSLKVNRARNNNFTYSESTIAIYLLIMCLRSENGDLTKEQGDRLIKRYGKIGWACGLPGDNLAEV